MNPDHEWTTPQRYVTELSSFLLSYLSKMPTTSCKRIHCDRESASKNGRKTDREANQDFNKKDRNDDRTRDISRKRGQGITRVRSLYGSIIGGAETRVPDNRKITTVVHRHHARRGATAEVARVQPQLACLVSQHL